MTDSSPPDSAPPAPVEPVTRAKASADAPVDPRAAARARIEKALDRARPRPVPSEGAEGATRPGRSEAPPAHHWSQAVRQRVSGPEPESAAASPETPASPSASGVEPSESAGGSARDRIRQRVEARLEDAATRRREAPPEKPPAPRIRQQPVPASAAAGQAPGEPAAGGQAPGGEQEGAEESSTNRWSLPARPSTTGPVRRRKRSRLAELVATCLFAGRSPLAPGTIGALLGLFAFGLTRGLPAPVQVGLVIAVALFGGWAAHRHALDLNASDPRSVVVDEFVGMWLALVALDPSWVGVLGAFLAFRALDIFKPPPVSWAERLPNGFGIMGDDLVAGGIVRLAFLFIG